MGGEFVSYHEALEGLSLSKKDLYFKSEDLRQYKEMFIIPIQTAGRLLSHLQWNLKEIVELSEEIGEVYKKMKIPVEKCEREGFTMQHNEFYQAVSHYIGTLDTAARFTNSEFHDYKSSLKQLIKVMGIRDEALVTFEKATEMLGVGEEELKNILARGEIRAFKNRGCIYFRRHDINRIIRGCE